MNGDIGSLPSAACRCNRSPRSRSFDDGAYRELAPEELSALVAGIEQERETVFRFSLITTGLHAGISDSSSKTAIRTVGYSMANCQLPAAEWMHKPDP